MKFGLSDKSFDIARGNEIESCQCKTMKKCILLSIQVLFHEMRGIQKACYELEGGYQPAVTFIVAVKRHHGRFNILRREDGVKFFSFIFLFIDFLQKQQKIPEII